MTPLVSIIVTTFNRKDFLKETLDSILKQTFTDFELLVIDNCSGYDFMGFIESYQDSRIRAWQNPNNGVISVNRNFGIRKASGKFIAFCDDDDTWFPEKLERQVSALQDEDLVAVGCAMKFTGDLTYFRQWQYPQDLALDFEDILRLNVNIPLSSLLVKNKTILFDESDTVRYVEDFDYKLNLAFSTGKKIKFIKDPLICYRIHPFNENTNVQTQANSLNVLEKYAEGIPGNLYRVVKSNLYFNLGITSIRIRKAKEAGKYMKDAFSSGLPEQKMKAVTGLLLAYLPFNLSYSLMKAYFKIRK